ncbi:putative ABC transport system ATP-binding protein [Carboxydocella thermautotrophica]|nr:putative ABC transport system ATP-binding protein [Carboxydocella thermautotrophica]
MALIKAEKLRKEYSSGEDKVIAMAEASFNVEAGEFLGIIGPSGSGKSTLLSILGGLNPPTSGKLEIDGIDVYSLDQEQLADFRSEYVGFVFQQFQLLPYLTALENVMLPLAISGRPKGEQRDMAALVLEKVGLGNKLNRLPNQLSGGEQERVAIARAIVNQPPIIFADEPTGALDSKTGQEIMELFQALNREGQTIIMVTHNLETLKYMHRALLIRDGLVEKVIKHESLGYCAQ